MALATKISNAAAIAACDAIVDLLDVGGGGHIEIRTGSGPADCDTASDGTLLATLSLSATAFGNAADAAPGATATAAAITDDSSADATGTAGYFRAFNNAGTCILQGSAGEAADTTDMTLDNKSINSGQTVSVTAWTVTMPES